MCGIIGMIANVNVTPCLVEGLKRLEYRGYDSAGIATLSSTGALVCRRSEGKILRLEEEIQRNPITGNIGIGHTRWATHGVPSKNNAHPHYTDKVAVVHNGIIENFRELRTSLEARGSILSSDTDTEVIPHLITHYLEEGMSPEEAVKTTVGLLTGAFAILVLFSGEEKFLIAAKHGSPLAIGYGDDQMYIGSDAMALTPLTPHISYLEDGDIAYVKETQVTIRDKNNIVVDRPVQQLVAASASLGKGNFQHYMAKEIHEQPAVLRTTLKQYFNPINKVMMLPKLPFNLADISQINIIACGTSYYAGLVAKYWLERYTRLPVSVDIASEFRYRNPPLQEGGLALFISQSGETADTLAALRFAKEHNQHIMSLVNVKQSSIAIASDIVLETLAGVEVGVASTKAFTTQLLVLACLTMAFADARDTIDAAERVDIVNALIKLPTTAMEILWYENAISRLAKELIMARNVLFIGRGTSYPVALESALKFKELTYVHAEGVAAGELKHGSLALVDGHMPVVAIVPSDALFEKTCSNIYEVSARGGKVIAFCDANGARVLKDTVAHSIILPEVHPLLAPILYIIPLQMLAYHVAVAKGNDVDQPRNLAKSVTVE